MANAISNMKMTNPIKNLVSKRRKRYIKDGFNLDLAYITDNVIAMGFPAEKLEGVYRNHIDDVVKLLEQKHKDHYKIYNLCSERSYDPCKFHNRVATYPFDDHNPPKIELIQPFCEDVHKWLTDDPQNVAAVHCKAGKGRTGTMICCYMLHSGQYSTATDALNYYGQKRAHDRKGVTIPSQRRYVEYYSALINMMRKNGNVERSENHTHYRPAAVLIRELIMEPLPSLNGGQCTLEFCVSDANNTVQKLSSGGHDVKRDACSARLKLDRCTPLSGDVKVEVYCKPKMMRKEKLFHFWFNTFFVTHEVNAVKDNSLDYDRTSLATYKLSLDKWQLDDAHKDKQNKMYSADFKAGLIVQRVPAHSAWGAAAGGAGGRAAAAGGAPPRSPSSSSASSGSSLDDEGWDSGSRASGAGEPGARAEEAPLGRYRLLSESERPASPAPPHCAPRNSVNPPTCEMSAEN